MIDHDVVFVVKNTLTQKEIKEKDLTKAEKILELKRKLNPQSKWILLCKVL